MTFPSDITTWKHNSSVNDDSLREILAAEPGTFLDAGAGDGFWGLLVGRVLPECFLIGVEKNPLYRERFNLEAVYDRLIVGDILREIDRLRGDLAMFGDVLEHLDEDEARRTLIVGLENFTTVIVNGPIGFQPQQHEFPEERHRCGITRTFLEVGEVVEYHEFDNGTMMNAVLRAR